MHAGKAAQRELRLGNAGADVAEIDLRHVITVALAGVLHGECHLRSAIGGNLQLAALLIEGGVAQAVAKRIKRLAAEITIGAVGHRVIRETWRSEEHTSELQ